MRADRFNNQLGSRDIRDTQRPWQRLPITRLPLFEPRHISSERLFSAFAQVDMFGAEPGHQTIKMQGCVIHRHIAEDGSCANDFDTLVSQKKNQRRTVVDLCARRSQADIGVYIDVFRIHLLKSYVAKWHPKSSTVLVNPLQVRQLPPLVIAPENAVAPC